MRDRILVAAWLALALAACTGDRGPEGAKGAKGDTGATGANGMDGKNGADGKTGAMGAMGDPGPKGDTGSAGPSGTMGADGAMGTMGDPGAMGDPGVQGDKGDKGDVGPAGPNGNDVIISDRAKHGLDISPAPIDTTGMTSAEIEAVGEGSYLINAVAACATCHGEAGSSPGFLAGTTASGNINVRNLTPDPTTGMKLTKDQFVDVIRTGADYSCDTNGCTATGKTILNMAWPDFRWASTPDLEAMYAYLKVIPAVSNQVAADNPTSHTTDTAPFPTTFVDGSVERPLPAELDSANKPIPDPDFIRRGMAIQPLASVTSGDATTDARIGRGSYLVNSLGRCSSCHTNPARVSSSPTSKINAAAWLTGGKVTGVKVATQPTTGVVRSMSTDLVGATKGFFAETSADFATFEGILQTGTHIDDAMAMPLAFPMPWQHLRDLTVEDLTSIYTYLSAVHEAQPAPLASDKATSQASYYCVDNTPCDTANGESCDLVMTDATFHECVGRTGCTANSDCPACQTCDGTAHTCGAPLDAGCTGSGI